MRATKKTAKKAATKKKAAAKAPAKKTAAKKKQPQAASPADVLADACLRAKRITTLQNQEDLEKEKLKQIRAELKPLIAALIHDVQDPDQGQLPLSKATRDATKAPKAEKPKAGAVTATVTWTSGKKKAAAKKKAAKPKRETKTARLERLSKLCVGKVTGLVQGTAAMLLNSALKDTPDATDAALVAKVCKNFPKKAKSGGAK